MKNIIFLLLICSVAAFGQKSVHVARYLGDIRYHSAPPAGQVKFAFERAVLLRTADGKKTYAQVLRDAPQFTDSDNAGGLLGIQVNGQTVMPEGKPENSASAVVPTAPNTTEHGGGNFWKDVPDSSRLEALKREMLDSKARFGRELAPRQEFIFWTYRNFALPVLFLFGFIGWLLAKAAYKESLHDPNGFVLFGRRIVDIGHLARYWVFGIAGIALLVEIANDAVSTFFVSDSLWWWMARTIAKGIVAYFVFTAWIVPNPRVSERVQGNQGGNFLPLNRG